MTRRHDDIEHLADTAIAAWWADATRAERATDALTAHGQPAAEAIAARLVAAAAGLWERGWNPAALTHVIARELGWQAAAVAALAAIRDGARHSRLHPRWAAELDALDARAASTPSEPSEFVREGVAVAALAGRLPAIPTTTPPPGGTPAAPADEAATRGLDDRVLTRVRTLLAKAESTEFPEEAEALTAKAQQLISRHAISAAVLDAERGLERAAALRRHLVDDPYADPKCQLVATVADANGCQAVTTRAFGWVTLAGDERDLDAVEVLATSLLAQATAAMHRMGPRRDASGRSRTRSFRRSFLLGFAQRIGHRLSEAEQAETVEAADGDHRVLPVLASREARARDAISAAFPEVTRRTVTVSHAGGWQAGQAAADLADLGAGERRLRRS